MNTFTSTFCAVLLTGLALTSAHAAEPAPLAEHPFFKHLQGAWTTEGELKNAEGQPVALKGSWKGTATDEGTFTIEGTRTLNDTEQPYRWVFTRDPSSGVFQSTHTVTTDTANAITFQVSVSEVTLSMELSAFLGTDSKITLKDKVSGDAHDVVTSEVTVENNQGASTLTGTIVNKRAKSP